MGNNAGTIWTCSNSPRYCKTAVTTLHDISTKNYQRFLYGELWGAEPLSSHAYEKKPVKQKQGVVAHSCEPLVRYGTVSCECGAHRWDDAGQFRSEASSRRTAATVCHRCQCTGRWECPGTSPLGSRQPRHIRLFCDHADALIIHTLQNACRKRCIFQKICILTYVFSSQLSLTAHGMLITVVLGAVVTLLVGHRT